MALFHSPDTSGRVTGLLLRCVLFSLLALGLIVLDKRYDHLGKIRQYLSIVAYPVQVAVASPYQGWVWFRESVTTRSSLRADNVRLGAQLRVAQFKLQRYEALEAENNRLRALREITTGLGPHFIVGQIVHVDLDAFRARVLVDKGSHEGVFIGQAVVDSGGVFGQVTRVGQLTSEVILISDPTHAIPVQINRNGLRTIAVGSGDTARLKLPYLPTSADVVKGDLLVTSGLGGRFPAGYPVGTVAEVKRDPAQSLADVDVTPAAALDRTRELLFVWPSDRDAASQNEVLAAAMPKSAPDAAGGKTAAGKSAIAKGASGQPPGAGSPAVGQNAVVQPAAGKLPPAQSAAATALSAGRSPAGQPATTQPATGQSAPRLPATAQSPAGSAAPGKAPVGHAAASKPGAAATKATHKKQHKSKPR